MKTILVVDDEQIIVDVIKSILERAGYHLLTAESGAEAFRLCEVHAGLIDLLITNHKLKSESGQQIADRMRPFHPTMQVLQISGWPEESLVREGTKIPGGSFLQKPFGAPELIDRVKKLLSLEL